MLSSILYFVSSAVRSKLITTLAEVIMQSGIVRVELTERRCGQWVWRPRMSRAEVTRCVSVAERFTERDVNRSAMKCFLAGKSYGWFVAKY